MTTAEQAVLSIIRQRDSTCADELYAAAVEGGVLLIDARRALLSLADKQCIEITTDRRIVARKEAAPTK